MSNNSTAASSHPGLLLRSAKFYDLLVWLFTSGKERELRDAMLRPAKLRQGESVLDVGCGTGTLALLAKRQVGERGRVVGTDASPEMIEHARRKAARTGADVDFQIAPAQALPFAGASFDVVLSTLMLHHLPRPSREQLALEMRRVLKPGGRALAVDFASNDSKPNGLVDLIHRRHGTTPPRDIIDPLARAGLSIAASGPLGLNGIYCVVATSGETSDAASNFNFGQELGVSRPQRRNGLHLALSMLGVLALIAIHVGAAAWIVGHGLGEISGPVPIALAGAVVGGLVLKAVLFSRWHRGRRGGTENRTVD